MTEPHPAAGRIVLIAGATSASGEAAARALLGSGALVLAVGRSRHRLDALQAAVPGVDTRECDLSDPSAVAELAMRIHLKFGPIDGLINLVGGWRGGGGIAAQSDDDWEFLSGSLTALRLTSRVFYDDLVRSAAGRLAIVSSTSVDAPTAGNANYAALKAAAETWTRAVGQGFAKAESPAAAVVFRVTALAGLEDRLAASIVDLWSLDAAELNGRMLTVTA
ncbi:MAG TPA: SDR family NAD(P)-dependent oxidoreductase [Humibacter sp.]|nr:SDR family NAD(P)-dependent oxidoreductase [Humibacter sp.]